MQFRYYITSIALRNPFNNETNLDYGVGIKIYFDDAVDNKFGSIYMGCKSYGRGDLKFYVTKMILQNQ